MRKDGSRPNEGRPSKYTPELSDKICGLLAEGRSLKSICEAKDMPNMSTIFEWMRKHDEFSNNYVKAKHESADAMAEEILYLSDTPQVGKTVSVKETHQGTETTIREEDMIAHRRLQVDTRKFLMAKMKPKKYGDKLDVTSDGKALPTPILTITDVRPDNSDQ